MIGTILGGRYEIQEEIGRGGMGVVYRAHDTLLVRTVAVKLLPPELRTGDLPSRFLQEARVMGQLSHPNIVTVHDVGEADGVPYFVMEFITGEPLSPRTPASGWGPLNRREWLPIVVQLCRALDHAHAHGVVHRDIKPENILLTPDRTVKLTDFGLARVLGMERISQSGCMMGTVASMAPEQVLGSEVDGRADLYSVGVLMYEFATDRLPFPGADAVAVISQHLHVAPVAPHLLNPEVDPALERLILKLLAKDPGDRFQSARDLERALEEMRVGWEQPRTDAGGPAGSIVTMVFVDLVNSTALKAALPGSDIMARNRAYFNTILTPHRRRVEAGLDRFSGRVVMTAGDDHFLVFPNAAQAAQWAVSLQTGHAAEPIPTPLGPLQVRIGMHTGAPLADPGDLHDYIGHEVDTAKRVSALASGGQILLSETTAALVRDARITDLSLHAHGAPDLKGIGRVPLFELLYSEKRPQPLNLAAAATQSDAGPDEPLSRFPGAEREAIATPVLLDALARGQMVGRNSELAALKRQIDAAREGAGATLVLAGEPGIGKTRLAMEASVYARLRGFRVLTGRCDEPGAAPYQPLAEAVREYLDTAGSERVEQALPPPIAGELARIVPQLAAQTSPAALPAEQARQALTDAVRQFFTLVTTHDAPVLLFLDDLHWADEGSLALLHALARQARLMPLLILGTYRDVELDPQHPLEQTLAALNRERLSQRLRLRRLSESAAALMVAGALEMGGDRIDTQPVGHARGGRRQPESVAEDLADPGPQQQFLSLLYRDTEGNPFFIEEVLKHLVEQHAIYRAGGRWQLQLPGSFSIPQSITVIIGRRLQRLGADSRDALRLAAVIGRQFSFDLLLKASGMEEERLLEFTEEWLGAHLVAEERVGRLEVYRFQHALLRAVPYEALSLRRRARLHEQVGLALEDLYVGALEEHLEDLAYHFSHARGAAVAEKGIDYCLRAGEKARKLYANREAIRHLRAALELLAGLPEDERHLRKRWETVSLLANAYRDCREFEPAQEVVREYLAVAHRARYPSGVAAAHYRMADLLAWSHGSGGMRASESARRLRREHYEKSLEIAEQHGATDWGARARAAIAFDLSHTGTREDLPRAEALLRETLQNPDGLPMSEVREIYVSLMQVYALQEKWEEVAAVLRDSIPAGGPSALAFCLGLMEERLNRAGKQAEFIAFCEEAKALYARAGLSLPLNQWYLEPAAPSEEFRQPLFHDNFDAPELRAEWRWYDPVQASSCSLSERPGHLTVRACPGVDLYPLSNLNAPRMLLQARGDLALETKMEGDWDERDRGISGLLVWKDILNYVRLEKFPMDPDHHGSIQLEARIRGDYQILGRGRLPGPVIHLRLERTGERVAALCSPDGLQWLTCGHVDFPLADPLQVGVTASHGLVVHFDSVRLLGRAPERRDPPAPADRTCPGARLRASDAG